MASTIAGEEHLHIRVVSRRLVKASNSSIKPQVLAVSNLDLVPQATQGSLFIIYPKPPTADFDAVVAAFEAGLPSLLNRFFPFAGRIMTDRSSGLPEVHCNNQGPELVVGEAGVALASLDYGNMGACLRKIQLPYAEDMALSVQLVSFVCGGFTVAWSTNHVLVDASAMSSLVTEWSEFMHTGLGFEAAGDYGEVVGSKGGRGKVAEPTVGKVETMARWVCRDAALAGPGGGRMVAWEIQRRCNGSMGDLGAAIKAI